MKQTEITVKLYEPLNKINSKLVKNGFKNTEIFTLDDFYFTTLSSIKGVSYKTLIEKSIIVRRVIAKEEKDQVLYKNKTYDTGGNPIFENKTTCGISSYLDMNKILESLGLKMYARITDKSFVYEKEGKSFCVQCVKGLGTFLEVEEFEDMAGMKTNEKINALKMFVDGLNLEHGDDYFIKKLI